MKIFALAMLIAAAANAQEVSFSSKRIVGLKEGPKEPESGRIVEETTKKDPINRPVSFSSARTIGGNWLEHPEIKETPSFSSARVIGSKADPEPSDNKN